MNRSAQHCEATRDAAGEVPEVAAHALADWFEGPETCGPRGGMVPMHSA
jgi:hypothetical protein